MKQFKAINTCKQLRTKTYTQRREKKQMYLLAVQVEHITGTCNINHTLQNKRNR